MGGWRSIQSAVLCGAVCACHALSQGTLAHLSPHEAIIQMLAGKPVQVEYGRPYLRDRRLIGNIVKYGQMWRTGADEAPVLSVEGPVAIGNLKVPAGRYSLFTIPEKDHWTLVINKVPDLMGRNNYNRKKDLGRVQMSLDTRHAATEQFTISIDKTSDNSGVLKMAWGTVSVSVPIAAAE